MHDLVTRIIKETGEIHDSEIVEYGLLALLDAVNTSGIVFLGGVIQHRTIESIIYIICSFIGTSTMGGYHCKSRKSCLFLTLFLFQLCIVAEKAQSKLNLQYLIWISLTSIYFVLLLAPAQHINKPLSRTVKQINKIRSFYFDMSLSIMAVILFCFAKKELVMFLLVLKAELIISMMLGKGVNAYVENQNGEIGSKTCRENSDDCIR